MTITQAFVVLLVMVAEEYANPVDMTLRMNANYVFSVSCEVVLYYILI